MSDNNKEILVGLLIGALAVGASAYLFTRREKISREFTHKYRDFKSQVDDAWNGFGNSSKQTLRRASKNAYRWSDRAQKVLKYALKEMNALNNPKNRRLRNGLIAGGLLGGLLATGTVILLSRSNAEHNGQHGFNWQKIAKGVHDFLDHHGEEEEEVEEDEEPWTERYAHRVNDVIDLALAGAQLWKKMR